MKIPEAKIYSNNILEKLGFIHEEANLITQNLIEAELVEKKTHGFIRLPKIAEMVKSGSLKVNHNNIEIISEHPASLQFDAKYKPGFYALYKSLETAFEKVKQSGIFAVAIKNMAYASGYIGDYARLASEQDLIYIGFHNSNGGLVPFGSTKDLWGTNPLTIGIPTHDISVILDMASSMCTWGDLMLAKSEGKNLKGGIAVDKEGNQTIDPMKAMEGGILPIAGHKGSGLAMIVELLSGGLSNSKVGSLAAGRWGSFYILIDPTLFRDLNDFKDDVQNTINELKSAPKAKGVTEIFFPGEQSHKKRQKNLENNEIKINEILFNELEKLS